MRRRAHSKEAIMSDPSDTDDELPRDLDDLMQRLQQRLGAHDPSLRGCPAARCRRARRCVDARRLCGPPSPASSDESDAQMLSRLQRDLQAEMARRAGGAGAIGKRRR
jgi:hypothetical protein